MSKNCVDRTALKKTAKLVRIKVKEEEIESYCEKLSSVVEWFGKISEVDTSGVEPLSYGGVPAELPMRQDIADSENIRDQILPKSGIASNLGYFVVKRVIK